MRKLVSIKKVRGDVVVSYMVILESVHESVREGTERMLSTMTYSDGEVMELVETAKRLSGRQKEMFSEVVEVTWSVCEVVADRGLELTGIDVTGCEAVCVGEYGFDSVRLADGREDVIAYKITNRFALDDVGGSEFSNEAVERVMPASDEGNMLTEAYGYVVREISRGTVSFV